MCNVIKTGTNIGYSRTILPIMNLLVEFLPDNANAGANTNPDKTKKKSTNKLKP